MADLIFPDPPLEGTPEWIAWAQEMTAYLNQLAQTFSVPSLVTGVSATAGQTVVRLRWRADVDATKFRIYRNTTGDFNSADIIAEVPASKTGVRELTYQDGLGSPEARYYWIAGVNEIGREGPKSAMVTIGDASFNVPSPGRINDAGVSNLIYLVADIDEIPDLIALATGEDDDPTMWAYIEMEDDFYVSDSVEAYALP